MLFIRRRSNLVVVISFFTLGLDECERQKIYTFVHLEYSGRRVMDAYIHMLNSRDRHGIGFFAITIAYYNTSTSRCSIN